MSDESLFRDRVPEAAARQLAIVLASATEWHLVTLEEMVRRHGTPLYMKRRVHEVCVTLVQQCMELGITNPSGLRGSDCPLLLEAMQDDWRGFNGRER